MGKLEDALAGKRVVWLFPQIERGSGGLQTVCRHVSFFQALGASCDIMAIQPASADNAAGLREVLEGSYQCRPDAVFDALVPGARYDIAIATLNATVPFLFDLEAAERFYFVQDYEPYFHAVGDGYLKAANTYGADVTVITIGRWLVHKLREEHGVRAWHTDFAVDDGIYRPLGLKRRRAVCAIFQPGKSRRCPELVSEALELVSALAPDVELIVYGSDERRSLPFPVDDRGLLSKEECNRLYNECAVGLCVSATNPSRIPFEMMAAGLPVVDVRRENTRWDYDERATVLADPDPSSIAMALLALLDDPAAAAELGRAGIEFMAPRLGGSEQRSFAEALSASLRGEQPPDLPRVWDGEPDWTAPAAPPELVAVERALRRRRLGTNAATPAVNCRSRFAKLRVTGLGEDCRARDVHVMVFDAVTPIDGARFDAYGEESGAIVTQVDFGYFNCRSSLFRCQVFANVDGRTVMATECTVRTWFGEGGPAEDAGDVLRSDAGSLEPRIGFEFAHAPFSDKARALVRGLVPPGVVEALRPVAQWVRSR